MIIGNCDGFISDEGENNALYTLCVCVCVCDNIVCRALWQLSVLVIWWLLSQSAKTLLFLCTHQYNNTSISPCGFSLNQNSCRVIAFYRCDHIFTHFNLCWYYSMFIIWSSGEGQWPQRSKTWEDRAPHRWLQDHWSEWRAYLLQRHIMSHRHRLWLVVEVGLFYQALFLIPAVYRCACTQTSRCHHDDILIPSSYHSGRSGRKQTPKKL